MSRREMKNMREGGMEKADDVNNLSLLGEHLALK
jgi:hypothetical protein